MRQRMTVDNPFGWLRANGEDLAPLTGQDSAALLAIANVWELFPRADGAGREACIVAVRALLGAMQPKCRHITRLLIARAMDWSDVDVLWPQVADGIDLSQPRPPLRVLRLDERERGS